MPYGLQKPDHYRRQFDGGNKLFAECWRRYKHFMLSSIDYPGSDEDVMSWLDSIASELVNDSSSKFYIHG